MSEISMVDKVGRAILDKVPFGYGMTQDEAREYARVAIEALRSPSEDMRDAMAAEYVKGEIDVWLAGIDAALSPTNETAP